MRRWTPPIRNRFAIGGATSPGLRPLRGHLVTMDDLPVSRLARLLALAIRDVTRVPSRAPVMFPQLPYYFPVFFPPFSAARHAVFHFSFFACPPFFFPTRNFSFSLFHVSTLLFRDTQFPFFSFSRVCPLFSRHAISHFLFFTCPLFFSLTRKFPFFLFLRVCFFFHRHAISLFLVFTCMLLFSPTRIFPFFSFCVSAPLFPDTQILIFSFSRVHSFFLWHVDLLIFCFACLFPLFACKFVSFPFSHARFSKPLHVKSNFPIFACTLFQTLACEIQLFHFHMHASPNPCMWNPTFPFSHARFFKPLHVKSKFSILTCTLFQTLACKIQLFYFHMHTFSNPCMWNSTFPFSHAHFFKPWHAKSNFSIFTCTLLQAPTCEIQLFHSLMHAFSNPGMRNPTFPFSHAKAVPIHIASPPPPASTPSSHNQPDVLPSFCYCSFLFLPIQYT